MTSTLKIYIDRLKDGHAEKIDETISSEVLDVQEEDLAFSGQISISGHAYLAEDHLIINLKIDSRALLPCAVCNKTVEVPIVLDHVYLTKPLCELPSVFNYTDEIREAILLQVPSFIECSHGKCPERESISKYFKKQKTEINEKIESPVNYPFADL
ncbi:MAG TPA: hypothetical protein VLG49_02610 [Rhabdochlamydiaceae bacterium]|nr:hypothetical protein [Rhabdochlamydiaceae bacterium]